MELNQKQYEKIAKHLPRQRGNVSMDNLQVNAILHVAENGCKWRALPKSYGNWHTVCVRMNRWSKNGVLTRLFELSSRRASFASAWRQHVGQRKRQGASK